MDSVPLPKVLQKNTLDCFALFLVVDHLLVDKKMAATHKVAEW
jgi:hypothetical protein